METREALIKKNDTDLGDRVVVGKKVPEGDSRVAGVAHCLLLVMGKAWNCFAALVR